MTKDSGAYEILSHVSMPECSIRIIRMLAAEHVSPHYHEKCAQIYTVLEHVVEATVGDHTLRLRPYETVRVEKGVVHSVRALEGEALVMSLSIPPLERDDQHAAE
ncbi:MAG: cupin domain-containing protein [Dehalococcoidia bacterium]|nr:cupin domain-containing protein [Dehalococcoidia bacterium]